MPSAHEYQGFKPPHNDPVSDEKNETDPMPAAASFERYKVLIRKLAHHMSGTGEAMTKDERGELIEIMSWKTTP